MATAACFTAALCLLSGFPALAQPAFKVLHYAETSGFDHQTRQVSLQMFQDLGALHHFQVDADHDGTAFNSVSNLQQYAVVVFSNTSGSALLDSAQRQHLEAYVAAGGSLLGLHAATDTYRHSTANGSGTGRWDWYAETMGGSVQENPNHVAGTPRYTMQHLGSHPSTASLPSPWPKDEEYYYWESGYYNPANQAVLQVEQTTGPNGQVNSYDQARPMSWYRLLPQGGRVFYTALGHAQSNYTSDADFRNHVRDALLWAADITTAAPEPVAPEPLRLVPNPARSLVTLQLQGQPLRTPYRLLNVLGQVVQAGEGPQITLQGLPRGLYLVEVRQQRQRLVVE